jgi:multimeric flavodoxin WrbA
MKATIFNGSPKKGDSLGAITSFMAERMRAEGAEVKEFLLYFMDIKGCIDCGVTRPDDELKQLIDELTSSEIVVFAFTVYRWNMSGALSAFVEELHSYCKYDDDLAESLGGRKAFVVTVAENEENIVDEAVERMRMFFEKFKMEYAGAFAVPFADKEKIADGRYKAKAESFAEQMLN